MTDHNYCSSNLGAETQVSTAAPTEGVVEPEKVGLCRISVNCPSINEIKDIIADLIHAIGARDLFRTDYDKQDGNRTLNPGQSSDKNYGAFIASRPKPVQEPGMMMTVYPYGHRVKVMKISPQPLKLADIMLRDDQPL